jgi:hypothetical protein
MKNLVLEALCAGMLLSVPWSGMAGTASPPRGQASATFEELRMHLEVDLPPRSTAPHGGGAVSLLELPAELVLEASSPYRLATVDLVDAAGDTVLTLDYAERSALGVSELALETEGVALRSVLRAFPPGRYAVIATTMDGLSVEGTVELSGRFPAPFSVLSPSPGGPVPAGDVTIAWTPSAGAVRYVLEIEQDELGFSFETRLPPWTTQFTVPIQVLQRGETYDYSLVVQGDTDNELELEGTFVVAR